MFCQKKKKIERSKWSSDESGLIKVQENYWFLPKICFSVNSDFLANDTSNSLLAVHWLSLQSKDAAKCHLCVRSGFGEGGNLWAWGNLFLLSFGIFFPYECLWHHLNITNNYLHTTPFFLHTRRSPICWRMISSWLILAGVFCSKL